MNNRAHDLSKAEKAPAGFAPIPNSKHGGFHKKQGAGWIYWYPGMGITSSAHADDKGSPEKEAPKKKAGEPKGEPKEKSKVITDPSKLPDGFNDLDKKTRAVMTADWDTTQGQMGEKLGSPAKYSDNIKTEIEDHLDRLGRDGLIIPSNVARAKEMMVKMAAHGEAAGLDKKKLAEVMEENVRKLALQEMESARRTLGDHGVRHLSANARMSDKIFDQLEKGGVKLDSADRFMAYQAWIDHDMGYTIPAIARGGFAVRDNYHPQASAVLVLQQREKYEALLGKDRFEPFLLAVANHSGTAVDWKGDHFGSTIRLADNTHLFSDKMPEVLFDRPRAVEAMVKIRLINETYAGDENKEQRKRMIGAVKAELIKEIDGREDLPRASKEALVHAAQEIGDKTPEFLVSRLAGRAPEFKFSDGDMHVLIEQSDARATIGAVFGDDEEDKQFTKLLKDYGTDPQKILGSPPPAAHIGERGNGIELEWVEAKSHDPAEQKHGRIMDHVRKQFDEINKLKGKKKESAVSEFFGRLIAKSRLMADLDDLLQKAEQMKLGKEQLSKGTGKPSERVPGGLASGKDASEFDTKKLEEGTDVEMEHTTDREVAQEIAMDHLTEDENYYSKLNQMEKSLVDLEKSAMMAVAARTGRERPHPYAATGKGDQEKKPGLLQRISAKLGKRPPGAGWTAVPGGKKGGFRKQGPGGWIYWYPGMGAEGGTKAEADKHVAKKDVEHHERESDRWREIAAKRHEQGHPSEAIEAARTKMHEHADQASKIKKEHGMSKSRSGEGSRGGHVIGHTSSGKAIYESHGHGERVEAYKRIAESDRHYDAAIAHHENMRDTHISKFDDQHGMQGVPPGTNHPHTIASRAHSRAIDAMEIARSNPHMPKVVERAKIAAKEADDASAKAGVEAPLAWLEDEKEARKSEHVSARIGFCNIGLTEDEQIVKSMAGMEIGVQATQYGPRRALGPVLNKGTIYQGEAMAREPGDYREEYMRQEILNQTVEHDLDGNKGAGGDPAWLMAVIADQPEVEVIDDSDPMVRAALRKRDS